MGKFKICGGPAALLVTALLMSSSARAQQATSEYELKAAFLFNFAKFVDWPASTFATPQSSFTICILGKDPFGQALDDALKGKSVGTHPVTILRVQEVANARRCQIVFVGAAESRSFSSILEGLHGSNALVVGESDGFAAGGGAIQFTVEESHVRFLINPDAGERAGLKFSSKLLALAKIVHGGAQGGRN